jgi:uncharacterized protein (DUF4415 family)
MDPEMTDRKRTKSEARSYAELISDLHELDLWHHQNQLKQSLIPEGWYDLDETAPCTRRKTKLTVSLDTDLVRWYRNLGNGYSTRINAILRLYMLAVISKEIERKGDRDWKGDPI